jgi:selenocysteine lyase/cysteine desulfurase
LIDFDQAATSGSKPAEVRAAVLEALEAAWGNPGRSGHARSLAAARRLEGARETVARFLGASDSSRVVFTRNATEALNVVLQGLLQPADTVLASPWEHNAVMRPLRHLERTRGINLEFLLPAGRPGPEASGFDSAQLEDRLRTSPVRLVTLLAASNVTGEVLPIAEAARLCRLHGASLLVDAAQSGGIVELAVDRDGLDFVAITGHKAIQGPPGIGALYVGNPDIVEPLLHGGTGSRSEDELQPEFLPDRFEAGTPNLPGAVGLAAAIELLSARGLPEIRARHAILSAHLRQRLSDLAGVRVLGPRRSEDCLALVSFTVPGDLGRVARELEGRGVLCRPGLQCAPRAHRTLGTWPTGTIRWSLSPRQTEAEIDEAVAALREVLALRSAG